MSSIPEAQKVTFCTILKNITKTNIILTFLSLIKIHLEKSQNTFVARLRRNGRRGLNVSLVCGRFRFFFCPRDLRQFINRAVRAVFSNTLTFSLFEKKVLVAPAAFTISSKHIVGLRWRCSCEMCRTSAVALFVISKTSVNLS